MIKGRILVSLLALLLGLGLLAACSSAPAVEETAKDAQETAGEAAEQAQEAAAEAVEQVQEAAAEAAEVAQENVEEAMNEAATSVAGGGCPTATVADSMGLAAGAFPQQYELAEFQEAAGCELSFSENPDIAALYDRIPHTNKADLAPVSERLPAEPLVVVPYEAIGLYGGVLDGLSNATEAGTSDVLSVRHVNLVRYADDLKTLVPNVAKGWEWNDDFTELTLFLRAGHKWSDGAPFTAEDIVFWYNDLILNPDVYAETPSRWLFNGEPLQIEAIDDTTVKFTFPVPTPGILNRFAVDYGQPFQPKHFFEQQVAETGKSLAEVAAIYYRGSDWKDVPTPLLASESEFIAPTLESHIVVEENTESRRLVANPYFFMVDTAGHQLPYISEINELYVPDDEVRNLKITNGEVDYKTQTIFIENYPLYKENEAKGNYTAHLAPGLGENVFYAFNVNHKDPALRAIFEDLRFRQAMSLALNRAEINEIVYLGQGQPQQAVPADPNTVEFVTSDHLNAFIEYDPAQANSLLDEMGLEDTDGDGFRENLEGGPFVVQLQYSNQGAPVRLHELVEDYWEAVGVQVEAKEVTSDEYREQGNNNDLDVTVWKNDGTSAPLISQDVTMLVPPFGDFFNPGGGFEWAAWYASGGTDGVEPPDDVKRLVELSNEFIQYPLGSAESNRVGEEIVDIHVNSLWKIGIIGNVVTPNIQHNTLKNFKPFTAMTYDYYWAFPYRPQQWYFEQ